MEKQIEEMAKVLCKDCAKDPLPCELTKAGIMCDSVIEQAEALYNAGYRKASEVAREIFEEIESCKWSETQYGDRTLCFEINSEKYAELKKKYIQSEDK